MMRQAVRGYLESGCTADDLEARVRYIQETIRGLVRDGRDRDVLRWGDALDDVLEAHALIVDPDKWRGVLS